MRILLPIVLIALSAGSQTLAQTADPKPLIEKALLAVGGREKLLKTYRIQEVFHFGSNPEPDTGKKRSNRDSILSQPDLWWINKKERGPDPAKDDARAWSLDLLVDEKSRFEILPDIVDEGRTCAGLRISGSVNPAMSLYFDRETMLLRRLEWRNDFYRFSEWKDRDGLRYASRTVIFKAKTGKPWFFHDITELERLSFLPPGLSAPNPSK